MTKYFCKCCKQEGLVLTFINISSLQKDFVDPSTTYLFDAMSENQFEPFPTSVFFISWSEGKNMILESFFKNTTIATDYSVAFI